MVKKEKERLRYLNIAPQITMPFLHAVVVGMRIRNGVSSLKPSKQEHTVLLAKSDSESCFVYKVIRNLESMDHMRINPIRRIGLIHK